MEDIDEMPIDGSETEEGAGSKRKPESEDDPIVEDKDGDQPSQVCHSLLVVDRVSALGS